LGAEHVKTAKEVLEWLGLLGFPVSLTGVLSYLGYLKWKNGRKVIEAKPLTDADSAGMVEVKIEGEHNSVQVHNHVYRLSENPRALRATRDAFLPLGQDGFDNVKVREGDAVVEEIDWSKVEAIVKSCNVGIEESKEPLEQWQDELKEKFDLTFDIVSREQIETSVTGNPFVERNRLIMRLDMGARSETLQAKLSAASDWDLVICDEAHRMSASLFGNEVKYTKRYKLGQLVGSRARHFLLMTATPHNGSDADFQLFMGLLDADRFEGRPREGARRLADGLRQDLRLPQL